MGSRGKLLFDLNEPPVDEKEDETVVIASCLPQKSLPITNHHPSSLLPALEGGLRIVNTRAFTHAASASGFQPFVRMKEQHGSKECQKREDDSVGRPSSMLEAAENCCEADIVEEVVGYPEVQSAEKEGELSNVGGDVEASRCDCNSKLKSFKICPDAPLLNTNKDNCSDVLTLDMNVESCMKESNNEDRTNCVNETKSSNGDRVSSINNTKSSNEGRVSSIKDAKVPDHCTKGDASVDALDDPSSIVKRKEIKGFEANHVLRLVKLESAKRAKYEEEQKLGKLGKTKPKTILVGMEDVKNNSSMKGSLRRQCSLSPATITRTVKDIPRPTPVVEQIIGRRGQAVIMDRKQSETKLGEGSFGESGDPKSEPYGDINVRSQPCLEKINGNDFHQEIHPPLVPRQSHWKQSTGCKQFGDLTFSPGRQTENRQGSTDAILVNKTPSPSRKQSFSSHKTKMHLWKGFFRR